MGKNLKFLLYKVGNYNRNMFGCFNVKSINNLAFIQWLEISDEELRVAHQIKELIECRDSFDGIVNGGECNEIIDFLAWDGAV